MRVYVFKMRNGRQDVLFRPARRKNQPMVMRRGLQPADLKGVVRQVLDEFAGLPPTPTAPGSG